MNSIIVNRQQWPMMGMVYLWMETGMITRVGRGARKRARKIDLVVWHWTGGEGDARQVYHTLEDRQLGIEFIIDSGGDIYQTCDPAFVDTWDAGMLNPRSVGVEMVNYGYRENVADIPVQGRGREQYVAIQNGVPRSFGRFWPAQLHSAAHLARALDEALDIPARVCALPNTLSDDELRTVTGHIGHFHITREKQDPGFDLLNFLDRELSVAA